jgi:hypothetical protein
MIGSPGRNRPWVPTIAGAVDAILDRQAYACQRRTRDPATGAVFLAADHLA